MSGRESCAAFYIPQTEDQTSEHFLAEAAKKAGFSDPEVKEIEDYRFISGIWGGLFCNAEVQEFEDYWLFGITFSFQQFADLINQVTENPDRTPSTLLRFISDFAATCDSLSPEVAFVEFIALTSALKYVNYALKPLNSKDGDSFLQRDYPLLYLSPLLANELEDWRLDRPRDEVPMRKGRLFYYGSGPDRWDLL